jgi:hypothetical protein
MNNLAKVDAGFQRDGILVTDIDYTTLKLPNEGRRQFANELLKHVRGVAGVQAAAIAEIVPLSGNGIAHDIFMGASGAPEGEAPVATFNRVSPDYFRAMRTAFLAGRDFDERDAAGSPNVAIVSESFVKQFVKEGNPIGTRFRVRRMNQTSAPFEIVGVVKDTKYGDLREEFQPLVYTAIAQYDHPDADAQIVIRSDLSLYGLISSVKSVAREANANLDVSFVPFHKMIEDGLLRDRLMARLSGFFGMLAVLLAVIGLYGVISYLVASRRGNWNPDGPGRGAAEHRVAGLARGVAAVGDGAEPRDGAGAGDGPDGDGHAVRPETYGCGHLCDGVGGAVYRGGGSCILAGVSRGEHQPNGLLAQ